VEWFEPELETKEIYDEIYKQYKSIAEFLNRNTK